MDTLLPIVRRKRRPLAPGASTVVPRRARAPMDAPAAPVELPREEMRASSPASRALSVRFEQARPFTRSPAFWALELQQRRRERRAGGGGPVLITESGDKLIVVSGDYLIP